MPRRKVNPRMRVVNHSGPRCASILHVEIPLGIVNIHVGLSDHDGRPVDAIEVLPSRLHDEKVVFDGARLIRLKPGETDLPCEERAPGVKDPASLSHEDLVSFVRQVQELAYHEPGDDKTISWDPDKESGSDFIGDVYGLLIDMGLCPKETT